MFTITTGCWLRLFLNTHMANQNANEFSRLDLPGLRELISETVLFYDVTLDKEGNEIERLSRVPRWCYEAVLVRGSWPNFPVLRRIVNPDISRLEFTKPPCCA